MTAIPVDCRCSGACTSNRAPGRLHQPYEGRGQFAPSSNPVLATDGIYGPQTATAVRGAQTSGGITLDGIVGLQTWALPVHAAGQVLANLCGVLGPG